jgi:phospholipase/carboxylesterase
MIHGRAGNEEVMWVFARAVPPNWLLVAPRAIQPDPDGGYSWHPRQPGEWPPLNQFEEAVSAVSGFIHALPTLYQADPTHIYLMGFSQGAATAYATAIRYPGLVKGIAGLVGFVPTEAETALTSLPLKHLPVFMAVGKEDPTIPYPVALACAETLRSGGAQLDYNEYNTGHKLNAQGMKDLKTWFHRR